jgi:heme-degrading monooxygenase HmoA
MVRNWVYWAILKGQELAFENFWRALANVEHKKGFYRETLMKPLTMSDAKFNTWSITDPNYSTYINIGEWSSVEDFERAVQASMPKASQATDPTNGRTKHLIELEPFEFKVRERIVLTPIAERGGALPNVSNLEPPQEPFGGALAG